MADRYIVDLGSFDLSDWLLSATGYCRLPMKRKLTVAAAYIATTLLLCAVLFFTYVAELHLFIDPLFARWEAQRILSAAASPEALQRAVGPLGAFFTFPDGSWVAIRYRDSHAGGLWSVAIARDSGGQWYQSREHFCGAFSSFSQVRDISFAIGESLGAASDEHGRWIYQLSSSPDLQTARQRISARYFNRIH